MRPYEYRNLTTAVSDKLSPLRLYLDQRFPNRREIQSDYRLRTGPLLVEGGDANPGTVGTAFDLQVRMHLDPVAPDIVFPPTFTSCSDYLDALAGVEAFAADGIQGTGSPEDLARASWAMALCVEVYRLGGVLPGSPLASLLDSGVFTTDRLMDLATDDALRQLTHLDRVASAALLPHLAAPVDLGPVFACSVLCPADADLIAGGVLLELKTHVGTPNPRTRERHDSLSLVDLLQVVSYALFDHVDEYAIKQIGFYSGRFGSLITWSLDEVLTRLAGGPVSLTEEREHIWAMLLATGQ